MDKKPEHVKYEWTWNTEKTDIPNINELFQQALEHNRAGRLKEAEYIYLKILDSVSDNTVVLYNLGATLQLQGKLNEAIINYKKAIAIKPDYAEVYNNLGVELNSQKQQEEAITYYKKAIAIKPNFENAYNNLGNALKKSGQLREAIICSKKANQGTAYVFCKQGETWIEKEQFAAFYDKANDDFSVSSSSSDDTAIVGASYYDNMKGAIYVYGRTLK